MNFENRMEFLNHVVVILLSYFLIIFSDISNIDENTKSLFGWIFIVIFLTNIIANFVYIFIDTVIIIKRRFRLLRIRVALMLKFRSEIRRNLQKRILPSLDNGLDPQIGLYLR